MFGLAPDSSKHKLRAIFHFETPLAVMILSSLCRHYIDPLSSGSSALRIDWTEGSGMSELMPTFPQLVDLDRLHHVISAAPVSLAALLTQLDSRWAAVPKRRSLAKGASISGARRRRGNTAQCSDAGQLIWAYPSIRSSRLRGIPKAPFCLDFDKQF